MKKGVALWVLGFAVYGTALLAALFGLERLFLAERDDARADVAARRRALETYAERSLQQAARERLDLAEPEFDRAARDPYLDDSGLRLVVDGDLVLPRLEREPNSEDPTRTARGQYERLHAGKFERLPDQDPDGPEATRLASLQQLVEATERCDDAQIASSTARLLSEDAMFAVSVRLGAPVLLVAVESLARCASVNPELLQRVLRDGMPMRGGGTREGLQRAILRKRSSLSISDLQFLCARTSALSKRLSVDDSDFASRCQTQVAFEGWPREFPEGERLEPNWFYRTHGTVTRGVRVELSALLHAIWVEMTDRGLLAKGDLLGPDSPNGAALEAYRLSVMSPSLFELEQRADHRLATKSGLLVAFAALAVALAVGAVVSQRRKQRYLELKSDFVAAVSHELRTPLASLRVMAETLEHRLEGEPRAKDYPRRIVAEADALSGLVENILSFNRLDKDRWVAQPRSVALAEFQKGLEDEARAYGLAAVELTFEGFAEQRVEADPELLRLLFSNLLRNACRYNAHDPVRVRFAAAREGDGLAIRAFDNGVGIAEGDREAVFEEFKRLKGQAGRGGPGSGLGLSLCRRIMGLHGGTLTLEASSPSGSTFLMRFPHA